MYSSLGTGAIGVQAATLAEQIALARDFGYLGVQFDIRDVADLIDAQGVDATKALFADAGVLPAGWGLPGKWSGTENEWQQLVDDLPRFAKAGAAIGSTRVATWILPGSNDRELAENVTFHVERFAPIAQILADHGCRFGMEFIGPKTLRDQFKYPFVWTIGDMLDVAAKIGPNVGLLLDSWHWYTSHGPDADLASLREQDVVTVHVADAPAGVAIDDHVDNVRAIPGTTGVINFVTFLQTLDRIGYTGPVMVEPFQCGLTELPDDAARLTTIKESLTSIFNAAGITDTAE